MVTKGRSTQLPALQSFFFEVSDTVFSTLCLAVTSNGIWLWVGINIGKPSGLLETYYWVMNGQIDELQITVQQGNVKIVKQMK